MESFDDIREKQVRNLTEELGHLTAALVEMGWSPEQVRAYMSPSCCLKKRSSGQTINVTLAAGRGGDRKHGV